MISQANTFRVFVSSTFSDLKDERNALQERVFPRLRELCAWHGARFQAIDLRWGVSEEASLDQQTMNICLGEIERCQQTTPRPNFIVLLGDRYGWCPPPPQIPAEEFEVIHQGCLPDDRELLDSWYRRDDNAVPPEYVLQPRQRGGEYEDYGAWAAVEKRLQAILETGAQTQGFNQDQLLKYTASATHQEIASGALKVQDASEHVFCFLRRIKDPPQDERAREYIDLKEDGKPDPKAGERLESLKDQLRELLPGNVHEYAAGWTGEGVTPDHLNQLCEDVYRSLAGVIENEMAGWEEIDPLEAEIAAHEAFGQERARFFTGRAEVLETVDNYLQREGPHPLAIWGVSGSGKSALMAKAILEAQREHLDAQVVYRFIGATPDSSNIRTLLEKLCMHINQVYEQEESFIAPSSIEDLVNAFRDRLNLATAKLPLVIFIDALDQLADTENAHQLFWLPMDLPQHVKIIVSTLPKPFPCLSELRSRLPDQNILELQALSLQEGEKILDAWLEDAGRTLNDKQRKAMLDKFMKDGHPLFLRLAFEGAKRWRSYDGAPQVGGMFGLAESTPGIIGNLLWRLSQANNHGEVLISRSLGYLAAAKKGLSEDELLDVLSRDDEVMEDFLRRSPKSPKVTRLPVVVWSRLYFDLQYYLTERSADGSSLITFFHRQLSDVVRDKYLTGEQKTKRHKKLAQYFESQNLVIEENSQRYTNLRKATELPYQYSQAKSWQKLYALLADLEFFKTSWKLNPFDVKFYWAQVEANSELRLADSYQRVFEAPESYPGYVWNLAILLHDTGHMPESLQLRRFLVDRYRKTGDIQSLVGALGNLASLNHDLGYIDKALLLLQEQERFCQTIDDLSALADNFGNQALIFRQTGELERALELHEKEERLCRKLGDREGMSRSLGNQGSIALTRGDLAGATALFKKQERICRELGNKNGVTSAIGNQGAVLMRQGDLHGALSMFVEQERICAELGDRKGVASALGNQGVILKMRGDLTGAMALYEKVERIFRDMGNKVGLAGVLGNQALIQRAHGESDLAMAALNEQEHLSRESGDKHELQLSLGNQALILSDRGQFAEAMKLLQEQETICRQLDSKEGLQRSLGNQANILSAIGDLQGAMALHQEKEQICRQLGQPKGLAIALANQASILGRLGNPHQALPLAEEAVQLLNSHGMTRVAGQVQPILEELRIQCS